jgi:uncharacterized protein DUF4123
LSYKDTYSKATISEPALRREETSMEFLLSMIPHKSLFAIIDACDNSGVLAQMNELGENAALSLFENTPHRAYWAIAPYLIEVTPHLLDWLLKTDLGMRWGIFVVAPLALKELSQHLSALQFVLLPDKKKWFFRYYDPEILETFLPTCNTEELRSFFGPVRAYITKSQTGTFTLFGFD